jgi:hypothetical protein
MNLPGFDRTDLMIKGLRALGLELTPKNFPIITAWTLLTQGQDGLLGHRDPDRFLGVDAVMAIASHLSNGWGLPHLIIRTAWG